MPFNTAVDIANRALQHCGSPRIIAFTDDSKQASETAFTYDKVRRAELRRNVWRYAIRTTALRPIGDDSKLVTFGTWATGTTYAINDVVVSAVDGQVYYSLAAANVAHEPSVNPAFWTLYFGPVVAEEYVVSWVSTIAYAIGDHTIGSNGSAYIAILATTNNNPVTDAGVHWVLDPNDPDTTNITFDSTQNLFISSPTSYYAGELLHVGANVYISLQNNNQDSPTWGNTKKWLKFTTAPSIALLNFIYPIGSGPFTDNTTKNIYRLPNGFLREAPQDPKAGQALFLGAPDGSDFNDWNFGGNFFVSTQSGVITFRFVADIADVTQMDDMFCEGLACRIAIDVCETLTQSTDKIRMIGAKYKEYMMDARLVNGIETGPVYPPEDSYIACRA